MIERIGPDAGDAARDGDAGQAGAGFEREVPDEVTLLGMVTLVRLAQLSNVSCPMVVTLLGMLTLVRLVQDKNARPRCW